jgi:trigger factor
VNATLENLGPCKKLLRVEIDQAAVDAEFGRTTAEFQRRARLPGFRPGKAPKGLIAKTFSKDIAEEVKRKLISEGYRKALEQHKLRVIGYPDIEEIRFGEGEPLQFAATLELAPEFELPEYRGIPVRLEARTVTPEDIERALMVLREQRVSYRDVARPVQVNDYIVINYAGTCEGKSITETAPAARGLSEQKGFWMRVEHNSFIPGFTDQLVGAQAGEKRTVEVVFPADFVARELVGKRGTYEVELLQVKERVLPELDEAFAKGYGAGSVEELRQGVSADLQNELKRKQKEVIRNQLVESLMRRVDFDLPESLVADETRSVVYDIVREQHERGVSREAIDEKKEAIYSYASGNARDRIKAAFLLGRIAEKENITATREEIMQRVTQLAEQYQVKLDKFIRELEDRNGIAQIREQIITGKVLDFLEAHAKIEEVPPGVGRL